MQGLKVMGAFATLSLCAALPAPAAAQSGQPYRLLVAFAPGGGTDILARAVGEGKAADLGQSVVIENRPGAGAQIATGMVAKAAPDGHTLLMATTTHAINTGLFSKLPYDSVRDFAPVSRVATLPLLVMVSPTINVSNLQQLIALAKSKPGALNHATVSARSRRRIFPPWPNPACPGSRPMPGTAFSPPRARRRRRSTGSMPRSARRPPTRRC